MRLGFCLGAAALLTSCATAKLTVEQKQAALDSLALKCGLTEGTLRLRSAEDVAITLKPTDRYEAVSCMVYESKKLPFKARLGFVGNEAYPEKRP